MPPVSAGETSPVILMTFPATQRQRAGVAELAPSSVRHDYASANGYGRTACRAAWACDGITGQRIVAAGFADHGLG